MATLQTTAKYLGAFALLVITLEAIAFLAFVYPFRSDEFGGVANFLILYVMVPIIAVSVGLSILGFRYEYSVARRKSKAFFVGVSIFSIVLVLAFFGLFEILNFFA